MEERLIEAVRGYKFLYNPKHKDYRDANVRQSAWDGIGNELQMTGAAAKEMWDKLRRCFMNARNRQREGKTSGSGAKKKVVWKYEEQMAFLLPHLETRKTHSNLNDTHNGLQNTIEQVSGFKTQQRDHISSNLEGNDKTAVVEHGVQSQQATAAVIDERVEMPQPKKRKESSQISAQHQLVDILKEDAALRKKKYEERAPTTHGSKCLEGLDEMDLFFLSMPRMTKQLPKLEQARIKLHLSNLVLSAEMQHQQSKYLNPDPQHGSHFVQPSSTPSLVGSSTPRSTASVHHENQQTLLDDMN